MSNVENLEATVPVKISDKEYLLKYNMHSAIQYNLLTGKSLMAGEVDHYNAQNLVALIWCGLLKHHPEFDGEIFEEKKPSPELQAKLKDLANAISFPEMPIISNSVVQAMKLAGASSTVSSSGESASGES